MLVAEGHRVGVTVVNEAVAEWKRQRREVFVPLTYRPGDLAEVDCFEVLVDLDGTRRKAWLLVSGVQGSRPEEIAAAMLALQARGCHNINFVTPEHVVAQILEAVAIARDHALRLPLVYNTSAYDALHSIELMNGIVDIYMPDFKYWSAEAGKKYLKAANYPDVARRVIKAMHDQVGPLVADEHGLARRGVLIRHLVMPGAIDETRAILQWIASELGRDTYVNLMDQYRPAGKVSADSYPEIDRPLSAAEFREAQRIAADLGLRRLDERRPHPRLLARMMRV